MTTLQEMYKADTAKEVERCAALDPAEYDRERQTVAEFLNIRITTLDSLVAQTRAKQKPAATGEENDFGWAIEPWHLPVDASLVLNDVAAAFGSHIVLPKGAAPALALWITHAWGIEAAECSPIITINSPEKRCAKTLVLRLISALAPKPLPAANITASAVFRAVERWQPTLLIDEADTFLGNSDELRGVINSGHTRDTAFVVRTVETKDGFEPVRFATWAPKAIAVIGKLPDTIMDRSIVIPMRRKAPGEKATAFNRQARESLKPLRQKLARLAADILPQLQDAAPVMPDGLNDRAGDNWRPLLAIADLAGGDWPARAREAARILSGENDDDTESVRTLLLADLKMLFEEAAQRREDHLASADIVAKLADMDHRPWPEWKQGKPITQRQLASLLKPFAISPATIRGLVKTMKGYRLEQFLDAFDRYLPRHTPARSVTPLQTAENRHLSAISIRNTETDVTDRDPSQPAENRHCNGVTDQKGEDPNAWFEPGPEGNPMWEN